MSNNANQTKVEAVNERALGVKREQYEFLIPLPEDNVSKILSASASVVITNFEVLVGEISYAGEACINIVYSLDDGSIVNNKNCENFSGKFENLAFIPNGLARIIPNVIDISIEKTAGDDLRVKITLENSFSQLENQEIETYLNTDSNIFVKESEVELSRHKFRNCQKFVQTTSFETRLPVRQILNTNSVASIKKADALDGIVVIEGETSTRILYITDEDRPLLVSLINKEDFREEIEDSNSSQNDMVQAYAVVLSRDIEENINAEEKNIEVEIPIKVCYDLFEQRRVTITEDAYSTANEINLTTEAFISNSVGSYEIFENKIDGNIAIDEQALRIDKILAIDGAYLTKTNEVYEDESLLVEGIVHLNVIYLNDQEENINSVSIEVPFSFRNQIGEVGEIKNGTENIIVDIDAVVKRGREIYVDGRVKTIVWLTTEQQNAMVSQIEIGEIIPERDGAIEIYFAKQGKTFWDVARDMRIAEDVLKRQNIEIIEPFEKDEKIVFYDQKVFPEI